MVIIKIKYSDGTIRSLQLPTGEYVFGSGLDCHYILLDPEIEQRHFTLKVEKDKSSLAKLTDGSDKLSNCGAPQQHCRELHFGEIFSVGGLELTYFGPDNTGTAPIWEHKIIAKIYTQVTSFTSPLMKPIAAVPNLIWGALFLGMILSLIAISLPINSTVLTAEKPMPTPESPRVASSQKTEINQLIRTSKDQGTEEKSTFGVHSPNQLDVASEVKKILDGFKIRVEDLSIDGAHLIVAGSVPDKQLRGKISSTLVEDISSITQVSFRYSPNDDWRALKADIVGVWAGERPYIVLKGDGLIRIGESFRTHFILRKVTENGIGISVGGSIQEMTL